MVILYCDLGGGSEGFFLLYVCGNGFYVVVYGVSIGLNVDDVIRVFYG